MIAARLEIILEQGEFIIDKLKQAKAAHVKPFTNMGVYRKIELLGRHQGTWLGRELSALEERGPGPSSDYIQDMRYMSERMKRILEEIDEWESMSPTENQKEAWEAWKVEKERLYFCWELLQKIEMVLCGSTSTPAVSFSCDMKFAYKSRERCYSKFYVSFLPKRTSSDDKEMNEKRWIEFPENIPDKGIKKIYNRESYGCIATEILQQKVPYCNRASGDWEIHVTLLITGSSG